MQLRSYQKHAIIKAAKACAAHKRIILQAPTGSGKTFMFSCIIERHLQKDVFNRVLVLTHRKELFEQTRGTIKTITGIQPAVLKAGMKIGPIHSSAPILMGMVETVKRRKFEELGEFTMCVVDEAHRGDFNIILGKLPPECYVIGATATPLASSKTNPLKNWYNDIVCSTDIQQLVQSGWLATPLHYKASFQDKGLRRRRGEFTNQTQFEKLGNNTVYENMVELWKKYAAGKKTLVFNINKEHTRQVTKKFREAGIASTDLLSGDNQRDSKLEAFKAGDITVLNNCQIATMGIDIPSIECVLINRATASLPLWLQMCGRGSRTHDGKDSFIILDFGGNIDRHGMWHQPRNWKDIFYNPPEKSERPAPMKECPKCGALNFGGASRCQVCGHKFPTDRQKEKQKVIGYLEKVEKDYIIGKHVRELSMEELVALEKSGIYKSSFIARVARTRGSQALKEYAELKGYQPGWVFHQQSINSTGYNNYKVKV
jgi:superfamily II DNA or RNA helicase